MNIKFSAKFQKNYRKRVKPNLHLRAKYVERVEIFSVDQNNEILRDHKLGGKLRGCRAFSITGDFRVVYLKMSENEVIFLNVGTHNQVYR